MKIKSIKEITPEPSRCIEVTGNERLFAAGGKTGNAVLTHNSVVQRNIIFSCIMRPDSWRFLGIDLKKVELSQFRAYSNVVLGIATTLEDALTVLRFASQTMMKRYSDMEQLGVNDFKDLPEKGQALLVMIDELGELVSPTKAKALSEKTIIKNLNNRKNLGEIQVGDTVFDNNNLPTKVTLKYEPINQKQYKINISKDLQNVSENFIAGEEHLWVIYLQDKNGRYSVQKKVNTKFLYNFFINQNNIPSSKRELIKFKKIDKSDTFNSKKEEFFTLSNIKKMEDDEKEKLYCIAVDSPSHQFLIGNIEVPTHNTDEAKKQEELKGEAQMIISSIARLGRAAGVHLVVATQRPDHDLIPGETKANLPVRINCGHTDSTASAMILDNAEGTRVKGYPRGRIYVSSGEHGDHAQGFFAPQGWIDEYLSSKGLNPDGSPLSTPRSRLANLTDISQFEDADLDSKEGIDNGSVIEQIREEEKNIFDNSKNIEEQNSVNDSDEEDDGGFSFEEDDEVDDDTDYETTEEEEKNNQENTSTMGRPELKGSQNDVDFHRPEDDWDDELDSLIEENADSYKTKENRNDNIDDEED